MDGDNLTQSRREGINRKQEWERALEREKIESEQENER